MERTLSLIKGRTSRVKSVCHISRLRAPIRDALVPYARFIGDSADYVLNQLIDTTIAKDRDFLAWCAEHPNEIAAKPTRCGPDISGSSCRGAALIRGWGMS